MRTLRGTARGAGWRERGDAGQALVEFALVLPLLLVLIIGLFEFGRAWNAYQVITDAAREGARTAVVANAAINADSLVRRTIQEALARAALDSTNAQIDLRTRRATGTADTVTIIYPYEFLFLGPLLGWVSSQSSITLSSSFVMRNE